MLSTINRLRAIIGLFLCLTVLNGCSPQPQVPHTSNAGKFYNPISNVGNDPWVVYAEGYYYLVESFETDIYVTKSPYKSLTRLASEGTRVKVKDYPGKNPNCTAVWAPELHFIDGKWYIYYSPTTCDNNLDNHRMFVLESETSDPQGPYTEKGKISDPTDRWAIDGTVFTYEDQMYMVWSGWEGLTNGQQDLYIAPMSNPWTISGERVLISVPTYDWEKQGGPPTINEGPTVLIRNGKVNIVYSASGSWTDDYGYGLLTNSTGNFLNPSDWVKKPTPVFSKTADVFGPGHGSFVKSPDGKEDWMVYHSARWSGSGWDRIMNIQKFEWNEDDTPNFGIPVSPKTRLDAPSGEPLWEDYGWGDAASGTLEFGNWTHLSANSIRGYSLGDGWRHVFRGDPNQSSYTVSVDVKWLEAGTVALKPMYGIYATYKDSNNYVVAMIDQYQGMLSTWGVVNGETQDTENTLLPPGTNISNFNNIKVEKSGTSFHFYVNEQLLQSRSFEISNGQIGMVTEDTRADYANVTVTVGKEDR
jgi:GH43 family beta-xylosidase